MPDWHLSWSRFARVAPLMLSSFQGISDSAQPNLRVSPFLSHPRLFSTLGCQPNLESKSVT
jgi:hypothetical protein